MVPVTSSILTPLPRSDEKTERFDPIECLDERVRSTAAPAEALSPGRYIQVEGPSRSLVIPLGVDPIHVGRGLAAELRLDEMSVSRRHAILQPTAGTVRLLDDRSSNGTFLNGERIQQAELSDGDEITVGRFLLRYLEV